MVIKKILYNFARHMKPFFKKHYLVLCILLLSGFANLYATSSEKVSDLIINASNFDIQNLSINTYDPLQQKNSNTLFNENVDLENIEEENEKKSNSFHKILPYLNNPFITFYTKLLDYLSSEIKEDSTRIKFHFSEPSLRLHNIFQVFII